MRSHIFIVLMLVLLSLNGLAQSSITITLNDNIPSQILITKDGSFQKNTESLTFDDGKGTIKIINKASIDKFRIDFVDQNGNLSFQIPSSEIKAKATASEADAITIFKIASDGTLSPAITNSKMINGIGITVVAPIADNSVTIFPSSKTVPGKKNIQLNSAGDSKLFNYVENLIQSRGYQYVSSQNLIVDNQGVIHVFLDENGSPIYSYFPVTAKENSDKFQFHILSKEGVGYSIESAGVFDAIDISDEIKTSVAQTQSDGSGGSKKVNYQEYQSPKFGPYSGTFPFTITRNPTNQVIVDRSIKLLKTHRVSLGTSVIATWLKNPENISIFTKSNGDSTLIADNPNIRGFLGLFLTFHLAPRNLNIPPRNARERLGISVGTNISSNAFNNFYLGLNVEVTNGLFINGGLNYGQVSYVINYDKFKFDHDVFSGVLQTKKKWVIGGPYVSINIDAALFTRAFGSILGTSVQ